MSFRLINADVEAGLATLPDHSVHCCVTSPPYWGLRDYGVTGQIGLEKTPDEYIARIVEVFGAVRPVLRDDGTLWVNLGDTYCNSDKWGGGGANTGKHTKAPDGSVESWKAVRRKWSTVEGIKPKDLVGIPWRVALALQADGWYLRSDIIWHKPNAMPESVTDRPTKAHEYIFLLSKSERYYYDSAAIREPTAVPRKEGPNALRGQVAIRPRGARLEPLIGAHGTLGHDGNGYRMPGKWNNPLGRNQRSVWTVATQPYSDAHFATFPPKLIEPCILAGCPAGGTILDPFSGSGTTGMVALRHGRHYVGIELKPEYVAMSRKRILDDAPLLNTEATA